MEASPEKENDIQYFNQEGDGKFSPDLVAIDQREQESHQRKAKKRLQLKNLIITKFRNKYDASASNED